MGAAGKGVQGISVEWVQSVSLGDEKVLEVTVVTFGPQHECANATEPYIFKWLNFILCIFYHKRKGRGWGWEADAGLEDRSKAGSRCEPRGRWG